MNQIIVSHITPNEYHSVQAYVGMDRQGPLGMSPGISRFIHEPLKPDHNSKSNPEDVRDYHLTALYSDYLVSRAAHHREFWVRLLLNSDPLTVGVSQSWMVSPVKAAIERAMTELTRIWAREVRTCTELADLYRTVLAE